MFGEIDKNRKTAIYIRISTSMQQTDRQKEELLEYANKNGIAINEENDIYIDIITHSIPIFSAYLMVVINGEEKEISYFQLGTPAQGDLYSYATYNSIQ